MIVACPNCQSKYNLPEEKIAPTGSKVRCARCKHVLLVEDIVDTGRSAEFLLEVLAKREAASVCICAAVDKHERREVDLTVDFAGFPLQKGFIVGYGMDYAEKYRELDAVYELVL